MGRQWRLAMRAAEQAGCVVSASRAEQPEAGSWSCSGVILSRNPGLVLCHGGIFLPFLRAGSETLAAAEAVFLPGDSCGEDLRLQVQWAPTAAVGSNGRFDEGRPGLCTPQCAGLEPGLPARLHGRSMQTPRRAELLLLLSCPDFRAHFKRLFGDEEAEQWRFASVAPDYEASEDDEEDQLRALGWFALLRVQPSLEVVEERGPAMAVASLGTMPKGAPLLACGSPFGAFCPDIFLNTLSRGVLSNAAGPLLLTDARCLPGSEGGGVFAAGPAGTLVALVAAPLCWKAREWVGLTLLCAAAPLIQAARTALGHLRPADAALAAVLPPELGTPRVLPLQSPGPPWAAAAVLVECGAVWGSGVAVAPHLVLTCRHVAPREESRVLVRCDTTKSVTVWGRVVFATQETSPYDVAVVSLEEALDGVAIPVLTKHFNEGFAKKTFISYSVTFKDNFRQGRVVGIDLKNQTVLLQGGEALPFSHLILATGSTGPFPGKFNEVSCQQAAIQAYEDMVRQVQRSQFIVVVGGGSAGVEMAAEIKTEYPDKEVTLIHSQVPLADKELLPCVRQEVKEILLRKGVQLLLGERVSNLEELPLNEYREYIKVQTDKGTEVATNLVILCNGIKINSSAYHSALENRLASNGALRVNEHLQVEGCSNVYAIGDCADVKEPKMAYHAGLHANVAVANIVNSIKQRPLKTYKPGALTFLLSMGRNDGVGQISGFYVGRLMVRLAKSRDLFVSTSWKTMKQSPP